MSTNQPSPAQLNAIRRSFRFVNKFMVLMWKLGMGRFINFLPNQIGRIMVIRHTGRKSGKERLAPVNYAIVDGEVYCTAGFGHTSDWFRNIMSNPDVELWLPDGKLPARAEDISSHPNRIRLLREVLIASGFAAPLFGVNPKTASDADLLAQTSSYRLVHFAKR